LANREPYRLIIRPLLKSKAKLLKLFPTDSFIYHQPFEIAFHFQNISDETFPGAEFYYEVHWPSGQVVWKKFSIPPLKKNEPFNSPIFKTAALCEGYGLILILRGAAQWIIKDEKSFWPREVECYRGEMAEDRMDISTNIASVNSIRSEEIYTMWGLVVSAIGLLIIALEKVLTFLI
jgi:hypothetical protein